MNVQEMARRARGASLKMAGLSDSVRKAALFAMADALEAGQAEILAANARDLTQAQAEALSMPLQKRLSFDAEKQTVACEGLRALAELPDPLGRTQMATELAKGLELYRVSCPIGVIGVVFESRPDALVQIAGLCIRSGNAVLLKGGREANETNHILFDIIDKAVRGAGLPDGWGHLLASREDVSEMLALDEYIDLIIPRGSNAFVRHIMDNSNIPVLGHADGICHVYVDADADVAMAAKVTADSKAQYVSVCNAAETLLVHEDIAEKALPVLAEALSKAGVTLRGDERVRAIINCESATDEDWDTEYLDYILSIKVVDSLQEAVEHINLHGSGHTDSILTQNREAAQAFMAGVDSAGVFWNCSTRFSDGFRYGFGAEVGVATGKLHARGPMGIEGLCTYKYKLFGSGQTVGGGVDYTHKPLEMKSPFDGDETV